MKPIFDLIKIAFISFIVLEFSIGYAHAYIDPGTGSFIIQTIMAIGATIVIYLGYPIRFVKNLYYKIFKSNKKNNNLK